MYVQIDLAVAPGRAELRDPHQFTEFKLVVENADDVAEAVWAGAARVGRVADAEHVFVDLEILKQLAGALGEDEAWLAQLEGMVAYAESKGWTDGEGAIRAHVELS